MDMDELMNRTKNFVLEIERIMEDLDAETIAALRKRLDKLTS